MHRFSSAFYSLVALLSFLVTAASARAQGLSAPTLQAAHDGYTIALHWTDSEGYTTNRIYRKSGDLDWAMVAERGYANHYWDRTTVPGVTYTYRVQAITLDGRFTYSNEASATTDGPTLHPPARPGFVAEAVSHTTVRLRITGIETGQTQYVLERNGRGDEWIEIAVLGGLTTEHLDSGLTPYSQYTYRVRGANHAGYSPYAYALVATPHDPNIIPPVPEILAHPFTDTAITLVWNTLNEATGYRVESRTGPSGPWIEITNVSTYVTFAIHENLVPSTQYSYRIRAYNGAGLSDYSAIATASTYPPPPPSPQLRGIPISYKEIELRWTDVLTNCCTEPEYIGYKLEAWTGDSWQHLTFAGVNQTNHLVRGLEPGEYTYRIQARHPLASEWSTLTLRTMDPPPVAPARPVFYADPYSSVAVDLKWLDVELETEYRIERENFPGGGVWQQIAVTPKNTTSYRDLDLQPSTLYVYRIRAVNSFGVSEYSHEAAATTRPPPESPSLEATPISSTAVLISVKKTEGAVHYQVHRLTRDGQWDIIYDTRSAPFQFENAGLQPSTTYTYRVRSREDDRVLVWRYSAEVTVRTPGSISGDIVITYITSVNNGDNFLLRLTGSTGQKFKVQSTPDFNTWTDRTETQTLTSDMPIIVPSAGNAAFYRTIKVE